MLKAAILGISLISAASINTTQLRLRWFRQNGKGSAGNCRFIRRNALLPRLTEREVPGDLSGMATFDTSSGSSIGSVTGRGIMGHRPCIAGYQAIMMDGRTYSFIIRVPSVHTSVPIHNFKLRRLVGIGSLPRLSNTLASAEIHT